MKTRTLALILILILAVLIIAGSCATTSNPDKMVLERFCGTWANQGYETTPDEPMKPQAKYIINQDGTFVWYQYLVQTGPTGVGTYTVEKRWKDAVGNNLYHVKVYEVIAEVTQYELWKIDKYASVWERNMSSIDYPDAIDPTDKQSYYRIYYRY
jgi:hypothetical protein